MQKCSICDKSQRITSFCVSLWQEPGKCQHNTHKTTPGTVKFLAHKFIPLSVQQSCKAAVVLLYNTCPFATTLMTCNAQGTALHIHSSIIPGLKPTMTKYNQLLLQKISPLDFTVTELWMEYKALNWIGTRSALEIILNGHNNANALRIQHGVRQNLQK